MERGRRFRAAVARLRRRSWSVSDEIKVRAGAVLLWVLVAVSALGGLSAALRPAAQGGATPGPTSTEELSEGWSAGAFGARFVAAYLVLPPDRQAELARFVGYVPDLGRAEPLATTQAPVAVVGVDLVEDGYWAVTVAVGPPGQEAFWRVGVTARGGRMAATSLPHPVPAPPAPAEPVDLRVNLAGPPSPQDPAAQTVAGFVSAYLCGNGELARYLAPRVEADPVTPSVCQQSELDQWGSAPDGSSGLSVVAEAVLDRSSARERRVTLALTLARRDGRWEVAELLPAPALAETEVGR